MKLFKLEVRFKRKRRGRVGVEAVVHARSMAAARTYIAKKYKESTVVQAHELGAEPKHFVVADLEDSA